MKKPTLSDFGLTESQVNEAKAAVNRWEVKVGFGVICATIVACLVAGEMWGDSQEQKIGMFLALLVFAIPLSFIPWIIVCEVFRGSNSVLGSYGLYEKAMREFAEFTRLQRKREESYWMSLTGHQFEHELASLYYRLGYETEVTKGSGDGGIDAHMTLHKMKIILQCKRYKKPVGPAPVREIFGVLNDCNADKAILACTGGFTKGAREAAAGKPIELVGMKEIIEMSKEATGYVS